MKLFKDTLRSYTGPATHGERHYEYLQRSGRADFARIRSMLEDWFTHYPPEQQQELCSRIQSNDDRHFRSAFFELYLHELLIRLSYEVIVHPEIRDTRRSPDFLAMSSDGPGFYLEATEASEKSEEDAAAEARVNRVYDALNKLESPDFFIGVESYGSPETAPPGRKIRRFLEEKLAGLSRADVPDCEGLSSFDELPRWRFDYESWKLSFFPIPKSRRSQGSTDVRPLGVFRPGRLREVRSDKAIRKKIEAKSNYYGQLPKPLVVAVNALDLWVDREMALKALYGDPASSVVGVGADGEPIELPNPNGAWIGPRGPRNSRVAGVLIGRGILPWNMGSQGLTLYHNPWTDTPVKSELRSLPSVSVEQGRLVEGRGTAVHELLGLSPGWPFPEEV